MLMTKKKLQNCMEDMSLISGQKPVVTKLKNLFQTLKQEKELPQAQKLL